MYPFYEKAVRSGITNICIHKGLLPKDYETSIPGGAWRYANVDDVPKAAKDWPQINFIIYHAALRAFQENPTDDLAEFERTGYIRWVSDLAAIPAKHGVTNVFADTGTSFAVSAVTNPRFCAAMMGTLIKGLGHDHVFWGTDSVWYGSPQWQIEAFRRLEIPEDMQKKHGFAPLGAAEGPSRAQSLAITARAIITWIYVPPPTICRRMASPEEKPPIWTMAAAAAMRPMDTSRRADTNHILAKARWPFAVGAHARLVAAPAL